MLLHVVHCSFLCVYENDQMPTTTLTPSLSFYPGTIYVYKLYCYAPIKLAISLFGGFFYLSIPIYVCAMNHTHAAITIRG